jgi:hypothetical protein
MSPAPNILRKRSQQISQMMTTGGPLGPAPRKMAKKPVSSSIDSQP